MRDAGKDVILLSIGDPDFDTPAPIVECAVDGLRAGHTHYTPAGGTMQMREAAAAYHERTTGQRADAQNIVIVPGAQCGLFTAAMCVLEAGDEVIVPEPMYVTYEGVMGATGARLVPIALRPENGFHIDPRDIESALTPRTRALLVNTPHNPTGSVTRRETWEEIGRLSAAHPFWVISDEVYSEVTFDHAHVSAASIESLAPRAVVVSSLSKSCAMTGWRIGWVAAPAALVVHMEHLLSCMLYGSPPFIQEAAIVALQQELPAIAQMREAYRARLDLVCRHLAGIPLLGCRRPEGGMYLMLDVRATGMSGKDFANAFLDAELVSLLPGEGFGASGAGHVRLSLSASPDDLERACVRLARFAGRIEAGERPSGPRQSGPASRRQRDERRSPAG